MDVIILIIIVVVFIVIIVVVEVLLIVEFTVEIFFLELLLKRLAGEVVDSVWYNLRQCQSTSVTNHHNRDFCS